MRKTLSNLSASPSQQRGSFLSFTALIALIFIGLSFLTRLLLLGLSLSSTEASPQDWLVGFIMGFVSDIATLSYALLPVAIFDLLLPNRFHKISTSLRLFAFFFITFTLIFLAASEFTFWEEFGSRFNFIAVDYLIYTQEVIDNIVQSYPVKSLLLLFSAISFLITLAARKRISNTTHLSIRSRAITALIIMASASLTWAYWSSEKAELTQNHYSNQLAGNGLYDFFSAYRNNELDYPSYYPTISAHQSNSILKNLKSAELNPQQASLLHKPKHIILITVESLSADYLGSFGNPHGLTPHLDELAKNGLLFTNLYAVGTRTVRGLEALSLSVPPTPGQSIVRRPHNENLVTLGATLNNHGFHSHFLYGGHGYFDNMNYYFSHNGYEVMDRTDIPDSEVGFSNAWGMSDEYLFNQAEHLMDKEATKQPQFLMLMTTSNHRPYTYPDHRIDIPSPGGKEGAVKYTDYAIGKFIQDAKSKPWFNDTLFVIVADHCASSAGKTSLPVDRYHIPAIFYAPAHIKPSEERRVVSQIDIPPTLLAMLGLPAEPRFFGENVWKNPHYIPRAFISNYQELGYLKNNQLIVLAPRHPAKQYQITQKANQQADQNEVPTDQSLADEAISFYQDAAQDFHDGAMTLKPQEIHYNAPARQ